MPRTARAVVSLVLTTETTVPERRRAPRYAINLEVDCKAPSTFLFASIADISELGVFVATENPPDVGTQLELSFSGKARKAEAESTRIAVTGIVQWKNTIESAGHIGVGVRFIDLDAATQLALHDLIETVSYLGEI